MRRQQPESALHKAVGELLAIYERQGRLVAFPVPNSSMIAGATAAERGKRVQQMKNAYRLRPGVWDWVIVLRCGRARFLELKVGRAVLSEQQYEFGVLVQRMGADVTVVRTFDSAKTVVDGWLTS